MKAGKQRGVSWLGIGAALFVFQLAQTAHAQIPRPDDAPQPRTPGESLAMFQVEPGFRVELVAAEPDLADPVAITFDADGNLFACEIHGYNLEGQYDIEELNKSGKLDKQVRRIPAPDWALEKAMLEWIGSVKMLVDTDGDGRTDRATLFADKLPPCYGLVAARRGIIVLCAPDIYYLADRDGDGRAEHRQRILTGFNEGEMWSRTNHLVWGPDNWIYACAGRGDAITVTGPNLDEPVSLGNSGYRFKSDGSAIEPVTGSAGGFGLSFSDWGDQVLVNNSTSGMQAVPIPYRYQLRNPFAPSPGSLRDAATFYDVFPISNPHPWRSQRGSQKAWRDFYGHREANPNGSFTASCSPTFYRGGAFPDAHVGNVFVCESQQNMICRTVPVRDGSRFNLHRPEGFEQREFLTSTDGWFRPVNLANGPDGGLYVVDMYREIIEDYSAIPRYLQQQYELIHGDERGRIWRIIHDDAPPTEPMRLAKAGADELVAALAHPNAVWRTTAQRLLVERGDRSVAGDVAALISKDTSPQARIHALYTLAGLEALTAEVMTATLADRHFAVRRHALQLAEPFFDDDPTLVEAVVGMTSEPDSAVRLQLALTLGEIDDAQASQALTLLAAEHLAEEWMRPAIMSSLGRAPERFLADVLGRGAPGQTRDLLGPLSEMIAARQDAGEVAALLTAVVRTAEATEESSDLGHTCLVGLAGGLRGRDSGALDTGAVRKPLGQLLDSTDPRVALAAYHVATALGATDLPEVAGMFASAAKRAANHELPLETRLEAISLLGDTSYERLEPVAADLLDSREPVDIQLATVRAVSTAADARSADLLLKGWSGYSPKLRDAVLTAMLARSNRQTALLDALETGRVAPAAIDSLRRLRLLEHPDAEIRQRASGLFREDLAEGERAELIAKYQQALAGPRDEDHGRVVFKSQCAKCHRLEDAGHEVGPRLAGVGNRPDAALLIEILAPSRRITQGYETYTLVTKDGRVLQGVLASESATSLSLRREEGAEETILRRDIDQLAAADKSLMPEDIEKQIAPADMADLLAYLRSALGPQVPTRVTLFDDEKDFPERLNRGGGRAQLTSDDVHSGNAALRIAPVQRYSDRIEGWGFEIVERPAVGQFRYLRMAWKSPTGEGAGVELAADGEWGPAASPKRRYYSGKNTAPWAAQQISSDAPRDWTVVTIDLWKDNGEFTLTGIAPTAMEGDVLFDRIELLAALDDVQPDR